MANVQSLIHPLFYSARFVDFSAEKYISSLEKQFKGNESLLPFLLHYVFSTGNFKVLERKDLKALAKKLFDERKESAKEYILEVLRDFESYDKEFLVIDASNQFELNRKNVSEILMDLERNSVVRIGKKTVELVV